MLRVRRGGFADVPVHELPCPEVRSTWGQYVPRERANFYGATLHGALGVLLVVVGITLIAVDKIGP